MIFWLLALFRLSCTALQCPQPACLVGHPARKVAPKEAAKGVHRQATVYSALLGGRLCLCQAAVRFGQGQCYKTLQVKTLLTCHLILSNCNWRGSQCYQCKVAALHISRFGLVHVWLTACLDGHQSAVPHQYTALTLY